MVRSLGAHVVESLVASNGAPISLMRSIAGDALLDLRPWSMKLVEELLAEKMSYAPGDAGPRPTNDAGGSWTSEEGNR